MRAILSYEQSVEQEVYLQTRLVVGNKALNVSAATIAGLPEKPNEDAFAVASNDNVLFAGVFDGVTSLKPIPALGNETGAHFASHFLKDRFATTQSYATPEEMVIALNSELLEASTALGGKLSDTHSLPATLATIITLSRDNDSFAFAHAGDCFGIVFFEDGHSQVFTDDKNAKFDNKMFVLIGKIAREKGITPRQAREDERVKTALIEMFIDRNNNPDGHGSGLVNGDPNLAKYIQAGSIPLRGVAAILLGTDGLLPQGWSLGKEEDRQKIRAMISSGGFKEMFSVKHTSEDSDPDWQHIRYKHSDDATGLLIALANS